MADGLNFASCANCCYDNTPAIVQKLSELKLKEFHFERIEVLFKEGEIIFKQGTTFSYFACFCEGMAKVYYERKEGCNMLVNIVGAGSIYGSAGMYTDNSHHLTVQALTNVRLCLISVKDIESAVKQSKDVAIELLRLSNESIIQYTNKLAILTYKSMSGRVADVLLYLQKDIFKSDTFILNLSRQDLADLAAMTKESFIRSLKGLKDSNIIRINKNLVDIIDMEALVNISNS